MNRDLSGDMRLASPIDSQPQCRRHLPVEWLLAMLTGIAHFLHARGFGLYEDDYHYMGDYLDADLAMIGDLAARALIEWPQGRPLQSIVPPLLTVALYPFGGLLPLYGVAFAVTAASVVLFYRLALRITASPPASLIGAVMFSLFPPDTTHPFLMHALVLRLALVCALGASLLYVEGRRRWGYGLGFVSLTLYETPFLVFLGAPLLTLAWMTSGGRRELLRHGSACVLLIALTVALRWLNGEERLAEAHGGLIDILLRLPGRMLTGASVTIRQMTYGPVKRIGGWDAASLSLIIPAAPLFYCWLGHAAQQEAPGSGCLATVRDGRTTPSRRDGASRWPLAGAALLLLLLAYVLSFTHQPWFIYGRLTSVHLAASVGGSLLFALVVDHLLLSVPGPLVRKLVVGFLALHFAILLAYRHTIQVDFVRSWQLQRWYWSNVVAQTQDRADGTVILVDGPAMPMTRYIRTNSWCDPVMFQLLFRMPADWRQPPVALPLFQGTRLESHDGHGSAYFEDRPAWYRLMPDNVVLLRRVGDRLQREGKPDVAIQGFALSLRVPGSHGIRAVETRPLYGLLIDSSSESLQQR